MAKHSSADETKERSDNKGPRWNFVSAREQNYKLERGQQFL